MMWAYQLAHGIIFFYFFKYKTAKFVPKLLNSEQKQRRMEVSQDSLNEVNDAELLKVS